LSASPLIQLRDLRKSFPSNGKEQEVLRGVTLDVARGETLVIIGASGGGKSVILKHCIGLLKPDAGEVRVEGKVISSPDGVDAQTIRRRMGMLFQGSALFDSMNAGENIKFAVREHRPELSEAQLDALMREKLQLVHLSPDMSSKLPNELSGGMKKRLALARALALEPEILLYDEPTTGLDPVTAGVIDDLVLDMQRQLGVTSLVVTHDMPSAHKIADRIAMLHEGKIIFIGTPEALRASDLPPVRAFVRV
jgi:phospholipid/cholesterol/gamma-HCH transport system ATP-binding protein